MINPIKRPSKTPGFDPSVLIETWCYLERLRAERICAEQDGITERFNKYLDNQIERLDRLISEQDVSRET